MIPKTNEPVSIRLLRGGSVDGVVTRAHLVERGRHRGFVQYTVALLGPATSDRGRPAFAIRFFGDAQIGAPSRSYSADEIAAAVERAVDGFDARAAHATAKRERRIERTDALDVRVGDTVLVRYRNIGQKRERVARISPTGRIGILVPPRANARLRELLGGPSAEPEIRWLDPRCIVRVENETNNPTA